ncbi:MAG TPA: GntG family PLP-dependent aldolase [Fimbriimonadaceae bacterium]|nr:GntG family PLP-dependent aldolase [Fimbriimonadaceae bacterium]
MVDWVALGWGENRTPRDVDLRSDTVTQPTEAMREAMARAPLGDDVLGDDPTVAQLERLAADRVGMEDAVFVPSGTMGNQIAIAVHARPGDAILVEDDAHVLWYEVGAPAALAGVVIRSVTSERGVMAPETITARALDRSLHTPGTRLLCVENTHNRAGGTITPSAHFAAYRRICDEREMRFHLDGARIFNAAVAAGEPVTAWTSHVDSVTFCLSKGLCAPVGSVLCGSAPFIDEARFWRKRLGGGMRQSGLLAACGIVALLSLVDRLAEDHDRARRLADALRVLPGLTVGSMPETNILMIDTDAPAATWVDVLASRSIRAIAFGPHRLRLVLHRDIDDTHVDRTIEAFRKGL